MNGTRIAAWILIIAGVLGLAYRGFNYTSETHKADIGSLHLAVDETKHVDVPVWAGIGAIVIGAVLLGVGRNRS
jgi:hypothetical protein